MPTSEAWPIAPGDVVVVPFPSADRLADKRRPALVVSSSALVPLGVVWVVMITSAGSGPTPQDLAIEDFASVGLSVPCVVRPTKIACIDPARILRRAGRLPPDLLRSVLRRVRSFVPAAPRPA